MIKEEQNTFVTTFSSRLTSLNQLYQSIPDLILKVDDVNERVDIRIKHAIRLLTILFELKSTDPEKFVNTIPKATAALTVNSYFVLIMLMKNMDIQSRNCAFQVLCFLPQSHSILVGLLLCLDADETKVMNRIEF